MGTASPSNATSVATDRRVLELGTVVHTSTQKMGARRPGAIGLPGYMAPYLKQTNKQTRHGGTYL